MQHIRPYPVSGNDVLHALGSSWVCPYCQVESPTSGEDDIRWVPIPIKCQPQRYICLGCCEDIHSTCASDEFDTHPYKDFVGDAAKKEGCTVEEFRILCLKQQIKSAGQRMHNSQETGKYEERLCRLKLLLNNISS